MASNFSDFVIPLKVINKILKSALPQDVKPTEEYKDVMARCAAIYILCISSTAQYTYGVKDISAQMVIETVVNMGFDEFRNPLEQMLKDNQKKAVPMPKKSRKKKRNNKSSVGKTSGKTSVESMSGSDVKPIESDIELKTLIKTETIEMKTEDNII